MAENEKSERDTHFQEAARLLTDTIDDHLHGLLTNPYHVAPRELDEIMTIIAQFAYDLVYHTLDSVGDPDPADSDYLTIDTVKHIPDMTERPHIIETAQEYDEHMRRTGWGIRLPKRDEP